MRSRAAAVLQRTNSSVSGTARNATTMTVREAINGALDEVRLRHFLLFIQGMKELEKNGYVNRGVGVRGFEQWLVGGCQ